MPEGAAEVAEVAEVVEVVEVAEVAEAAAEARLHRQPDVSRKTFCAATRDRIWRSIKLTFIISW